MTVNVAGMTLWSLISEEQAPSVRKYMADNRRIVDWSVEKHNIIHLDHLAWLKAQLALVEEKGKSAIVFSHHAPTFRDSAAPEHRDGPITTAFATDLEYLLKQPIVLYAFGHTHWSCDQMIGTTRVVSNQVGYPGEETGYRPNFVVEL